MKFLDKFYNGADTPWVSLTWSKFYSNSQTPPQARSSIGSFWQKDIMSLFDKFRDLASCNPSNGKTALFWIDKGQIRSSKIYILNSSPSPRRRNAPSDISLTRRSAEFSVYLCQHRLQFSQKRYSPSCSKDLRMEIQMTLGATPGDHANSAAKRLTKL